jgi:hypothetical protein
MNEYRRRLAAVGDGILLACARLYLYNHRSMIPYKINARLIGQMVCNDKLLEIAIREGLTAIEGEKLSDSFEVEVAEHFFAYGFRSTRLWLEQVYQKHFDLQDEIRRILEPTPQDKVEAQIRGALKTATQRGQLDIQKTARTIVKVLRDAGSI